MYSYLRWSILEISEGKVSLLVSNTGLGFEVFLSPLSLARVSLGEEVEFFIYHHITEVSQTLFGFMEKEEREVFKKLLKVSGVGGKTAISILGLGIRDLIGAIEANDDKMLATVPGVGKKMALKIILELKNKVTMEDLMEIPQEPLRRQGNTEILDTLVGMGYDKRAVEKVLESISSDVEKIEDRIIQAIRLLAKSV